MKIKYAFMDGTVTEVEVSDEIGAVIIDSRKAEHAQDERHRYHCYSYGHYKEHFPLCQKHRHSFGNRPRAEKPGR